MTTITNNADALRAHKTASQKETRVKLELAVRRIVNGNPQRVKKGTPLSPAAVAQEAGIDRTTLYRYHEPVLTEIRRITDATPQKKLREKHTELADAVTRAKEYRLLLEKEQTNLANIGRENYVLRARVRELEGLLANVQSSGNVASISAAKKRES